MLSVNPVYAADEEPAAENEVEAEEEQELEDPFYTFVDEKCDFKVWFPEEPYPKRLCSREGSKFNLQATKECMRVHSYSTYFEPNTTIDVTISCAPAAPEMLAQYDERTMKHFAGAMADQHYLRDASFRYQDKGTARVGSISGTGMTGEQRTIYVGEVWAGPTSTLTIEAQLIGPRAREADKVFNQILKSVTVKPVEEEPAF